VKNKTNTQPNKKPYKKTNAPSNKEPSKGKLRENIEAVVIAVALALFINTFIVKTYKVPSGSMEPTIQIGDRILVNKFIYGVKLPFIHKTIISVKEPKQGDIVVFVPPMPKAPDYIKRVVGVGGDKIEIRDKQLFVNGKATDMEQAVFTDKRILTKEGASRGLYPKKAVLRDNYGPIVVPEDKLFVMGDNRDNSNDSRFWGFADLKYVKGKAFIIYWSLDKSLFDVRWGRIGHLLK
jgi:signal peptidase I